MGASRSTPEKLIDYPNYIHLNIDITFLSHRASFSSILREHLTNLSSLNSQVSVIFMAGSNLVKPFPEYTQ